MAWSMRCSAPSAHLEAQFFAQNCNGSRKVERLLMRGAKERYGIHNRDADYPSAITLTLIRIIAISLCLP